MTPEAVNGQINADLDKPAHKLLIKVLILFVIGFAIMGYFGAKLLINAYDERYKTVTSESAAWKKLYFEEKQSNIDCMMGRIGDNREARIEYDTIQQLIMRKRK